MVAVVSKRNKRTTPTLHLQARGGGVGDVVAIISGKNQETPPTCVCKQEEVVMMMWPLLGVKQSKSHPQLMFVSMRGC
jgi:hypothetical protein